MMLSNSLMRFAGSSSAVRAGVAGAVVLALSLAAPAAEAAKPQAGFDFDPESGLTLRFGEGRKAAKLILDGRIHADYAQYSNDGATLNDGFLLRRARPALALDLGDWKIKGEYEFSPRSKGIRQAWVDYSGFKRTSLRLGNQPTSFGFESSGSSNDNPFMERSVASALAPGIMLGLTMRKWDDRWNVTLGAHTNDISDDEQRGLDGRGVTLRVVGQPYKARRTRLHVGASMEVRDANAVGSLRYRIRPESNIDGGRLIDTGVINGVDGLVTAAVEAAWQRGPLLLNAEYLQSRVATATGPDLEFSGWEATASYFLTGERREYSEAMGSFGAVDPRRKWGAVELKARLSEVDLSDGGFNGGMERNEAFGVNWWYSQKIRVLAEYIRVHAKPGANGLLQDPTVAQVRLQVAF
jgi:phosphate-selective porin OprO/OprP